MFGGLTKYDNSTVTNENIEEIVELTQYYGFHTDKVKNSHTKAWTGTKPSWEFEYMKKLEER